MPPHISASPPTSPLRPSIVGASDIVDKFMSIVENEEERQTKFSFYDTNTSAQETAESDGALDVDAKDDCDAEEEKDLSSKDGNVHQFYPPSAFIGVEAEDSQEHEEESAITNKDASEETMETRDVGFEADDSQEHEEESAIPEKEACGSEETTETRDVTDCTARLTKFAYYESNIDEGVQANDSVPNVDKATKFSFYDSNIGTPEIVENGGALDDVHAKDDYDAEEEKELSSKDDSVPQFFYAPSNLLGVEAEDSQEHEEESAITNKDATEETMETRDVKDCAAGSTRFSYYKSNIDESAQANTGTPKIDNAEKEETRNVHQFYSATEDESREGANSFPLELKDYTTPSSRKSYLSSINRSTMDTLELLQAYHQHKRTEVTLLDQYGFRDRRV